MGLNISEVRSIFQNELDKQMMEILTSSFLDDNAGQVIYTGGKEIKIPRISMEGLKDYSRSDGYPDGAITLEYQTVTMKMDRGMGITLDAMDVDESNFLASAGNIMGEFQRTKVVPEVDAYRYSSIFKEVKAGASANIVAKNLTEKDIYKTLTEDIAIVKDRCGESTDIVIIMNTLTKALLENNDTFTKTLTQVDFTKGDISTKVRAINDCPIISVPSDRMYTEYTFNKGREDGADKKGGFVKKADAKLINYIVMPKAAAIAVCKQDKSKIIEPELNQKADAWFIGYRKYHDIWVKKNSLEAIIISTKA